MAREELVQGIRQALTKGESLRDAMMSFLNAGYLKEDIEDAARIVQSDGTNYVEKKIELPKELPKKESFQVEAPKVETFEKVDTVSNIPVAPAINQKVSAYTSKPQSSMGTAKKMFLIILFIFLSLIGLSIAALLIFRETFIQVIFGA